MPRQPREQKAGEIYHVVCRGNQQQPIFDGDEDYQLFLGTLGNVCKTYDMEVLAYCLMTNHVHLAVRAGKSGLSAPLHRVLSGYAQRFHVRHTSSGHLFQGRFFSKHVRGPIYLRALLRYIHLNPVKAGLVGAAEKYAWSSHRVYLGSEENALLNTAPGLEAFGGTKGYREMMHNGGQDAAAVACDWELAHLLDAVADTFELTAAELRGESRGAQSAKARATAALFAKKIPGITLTDLANFFGQSTSALSVAAKRLESRLEGNPEWQSRVDHISNTIELAVY